MAKAQKNGRSELVYLPLGGAGEIGMNLYLYGYGPPERRQWLMVDLGVTFPGDLEPGVDVILPDTRFIEEERSNLVGVVLTHAHEDHFGAVIDLWEDLGAPIYATPFTAALLKTKLAEYGDGLVLPIHEVDTGQPFEVGPFALELIAMAHSIPEPNALAIRTPLGLVVHTGDWKLDPDPVVGPPSDEARLRALGGEDGGGGVDVLVCDSTNVFRDGVSPSEAEVGRSLEALIKSAQRRVAVTTFASNIARVLSVANAARAAGREFVVAGRAMLRLIQVAIDTGHLPPDFRFLPQEAYERLPREKVVLMCTGSQGEPRAAVARIAADQHPHISLSPGDRMIFSSRTIPGNEKAVARVQNALCEQGVEVITDAQALVHVTGHPRRGELERIYRWCRPKAVVPMHGEMRHLLEHVRFARACGIEQAIVVRNGDVARLLPGPAAVIDEAPSGRSYRDGDLILEGEDASVRERRKLAYCGIVFVSLALSENGEIVSEAEAVVDGVPSEDDEGVPMEEIVASAVDGALNSIPKARRRDAALVAEAARRAARNAVAAAWGKRPIVKVVVHAV